MRLLAALIGLATMTVAWAATVANPPHAPGFTRIVVEFADAPPLMVELWYPAPAGADRVRIADNAVWQGTLAAVDAEAVAGRHPVVLLSHGLDGAARNLGWLAAELAVAGHVVVAPDHTGTSFAAPDRALRADLAVRPAQLHRALRAVLADPRFGPLIDRDRVAAIGHSLGGFTVLAAAGVGIDLARLDCSDAEDRPDCAFLAEAGVALGEPARRPFDSVTPIRTLVTLDTGLTQALDRADLAALEARLLVIGAGAPDNPVPLELESRALAAAVPDAAYVEFAGVGHFDFLNLCTSEGLAILAEEVPEAVLACTASPTPRATAHARTVEAILDHLVAGGG
jgi:predicted dienelactone hydrolase